MGKMSRSGDSVHADTTYPGDERIRRLGDTQPATALATRRSFHQRGQADLDV